METAARTATDWTFRDRSTGRIVIAQRPNAPLLTWLFCALLRRAVRPSGTAGTVLETGGRAALKTWAIGELARGVNPWRRMLGGSALAALTVAGIRSR